MHVEIKCLHCDQVITHICDEDVTKAAKRLYEYKLEFPAKAVKKAFKAMTDNAFFEEGDEEATFFSEAFLYNLIGKEDARTVLGMIRGLLEAAGVDPYGVMR